MAHEFMSPERTGLIVPKVDLADVQGDQVRSVFKVSGSLAIKKKKNHSILFNSAFPNLLATKVSLHGALPGPVLYLILLRKHGPVF